MTTGVSRGLGREVSPSRMLAPRVRTSQSEITSSMRTSVLELLSERNQVAL